MAAVRSGQHARCGGHSDCRGYGGVARMQPSAVPRHEYPDRCEREQSCLGQFAKLGLAREETGDNKSGSDSSHAEEFRFCQGITPSNSKGGLPAPEAGARAQEGGVGAKIDLAPSRSEDSQDKAETQSSRVDSAPRWSREERDQEAPLRRKQRAGMTPSHLQD